MSGKCLVCNRITSIQNNINPYFVTELETGYVVIGDYQYFKVIHYCSVNNTKQNYTNWIEILD